MPRLPADAKFDTPDSSIRTEVPHAATSPRGLTTPPYVEPKTTLAGAEGAITRALAPLAIGAGAGGMVGGPPGAAAGGGAMLLTEMAVPLYNKLADKFNWSKLATPEEMTDTVLDYLGVAQPKTGVERVIGTTAGGAANAFGGAKAVGQLAEKSVDPLLKGLFSKMAENPVQQTLSGAGGGAAGQTAAEKGAGPSGQFLASLAGSALLDAPLTVRPASPPRQAALNARKHGYVLPPGSVSEHPGMLTSGLAGFSGRVKVRQAASVKNQAITNKLAAQALGLPGDTLITDTLLQDVRRDAGRAYQNVIQTVPTVSVDGQFSTEIASLAGQNMLAVQTFPEIMRNPQTEALISSLGQIQQFPTEAGMELVKKLRFDATANLKASDDPAKLALGMAQRHAAEAVDSVIERNATAIGHPDVVDEYKKARQLIARSYDIELALNPATNDVNAKVLSSLSNKGRPLSGELADIAQTAQAFPWEMRSPSSFGYEERFSFFDVLAATAAATHGRPEIAGALVGRPAIRSMMLSQPYQNALTKERGIPLPLITNPGYLAVKPPPSLSSVLSQNGQKP